MNVLDESFSFHLPIVLSLTLNLSDYNEVDGFESLNYIKTVWNDDLNDEYKTILNYQKRFVSLVSNSDGYGPF